MHFEIICKLIKVAKLFFTSLFHPKIYASTKITQAQKFRKHKNSANTKIPQVKNLRKHKNSLGQKFRNIKNLTLLNNDNKPDKYHHKIKLDSHNKVSLIK